MMTVEQALPEAIDYLFPTTDLVSLIPMEPMPYEQVQKVQGWLNDLVNKKVKLKRPLLKTLKDAWLEK